MSALSRARAAYIDHPSDARLRAYLTLKARVGLYDRRMLAYYGVPHVDNRDVQKAVCRAYAAGLVPTATTNGQHAPGSYHRLGRAVDFGLRRTLIGTRKGQARLATFQRKELWRATNGRRIVFVELIGPTNTQNILRTVRQTLPEGSALEDQHDNHVHEAFLG